MRIGVPALVEAVSPKTKPLNNELSTTSRSGESLTMRRQRKTPAEERRRSADPVCNSYKGKKDTQTNHDEDVHDFGSMCGLRLNSGTNGIGKVSGKAACKRKFGFEVIVREREENGI
jgi:hypothetical protein